MCELNQGLFNSRSSEYKTPFGAAESGSRLRFKIKPPRYYGAASVSFVLMPDGGTAKRVPMEWQGMQGDCDIYACEATAGEAGLYWYWFELDSLSSVFSVARAGVVKGTVEDTVKTPLWQLTVYNAGFKTPEWLKGGILYQIFPDRFCREGDFPGNLPDDRRLVQTWGGFPAPDGTDDYYTKTYFGGNLKGITAKLDYLQSAGVTAIYLNPIFEAHASHRYNTADYMRIDSMLGDENDLRTLCVNAKERGIQVILDGVFSHTGADSVYFNRYGRYSEAGAYQSKDSKYSDWYNFDEWPNRYRSWWGFEDLPEVTETTPSFLEYILGKDGVVAHWLRAGISGWRLDVADELPEGFLRRLRERVKAENPEAVIIGEVWENASNKISYGERRHYFGGDELDSVMNYPFRDAIVKFLKEKDAEFLHETVMELLEDYPKPVIDVLMNLVGSHDTIRMITLLAGEDPDGRDNFWKFNTRLSQEQREKGLRLVALAAAVQFFLPGVPCIYYGDEAGMEGYADPFNRGCFPWGGEDRNLLSLYKELGAIRNSCEALQSGGYRTLAANGGLFAFARQSESCTVISAVNCTDIGCELELNDTRLKVLLGGAKLDGSVLRLPAYSFAILGRGAWVEKIRAVR